MADEERETRIQLAACYRLMAHYGMDDLTCNDLSARVPIRPDVETHRRRATWIRLALHLRSR